MKLAPGVRGLKGRNVGVGFGSDLSEEPAVQDVEPVTLDYVVVPECPPEPTLFSVAGVLSVGDEVLVNGVGDLALQRPDRFFGCLAFSDPTVVIGTAGVVASEL